MMTKAVLKRAVSAMFAPGFGQRPRQQSFVSETEDIKHPLKCWGCGLPGHKRGDPACKADANTVHESAPGRAKRKFNGNLERSSGGGPTVKNKMELASFSAETAIANLVPTANSNMNVVVLQSLKRKGDFQEKKRSKSTL